MQIVHSSGTPWEIGAQFESWRVGLLSYGEKFSRFFMLERHNRTDEVFVLVKGEATLYIADKDINVSEYKMEKGVIYNVAKSEWHGIVVSRDALVMVVENEDTTEENSDYIYLT